MQCIRSIQNYFKQRRKETKKRKILEKLHCKRREVEDCIKTCEARCNKNKQDYKALKTRVRGKKFGHGDDYIHRHNYALLESQMGITRRSMRNETLNLQKLQKKHIKLYEAISCIEMPVYATTTVHDSADSIIHDAVRMIDITVNDMDMIHDKEQRLNDVYADLKDARNNLLDHVETDEEVLYESDVEYSVSLSGTCSSTEEVDLNITVSKSRRDGADVSDCACDSDVLQNTCENMDTYTVKVDYNNKYGDGGGDGNDAEDEDGDCEEACLISVDQKVTSET